MSISGDNSQGFSPPGQVSLSNRGETSSLNEPLPLGVDRLSVSFEVYDFDQTQQNWDSYTQMHSTARDDRTGVVHSLSRSVEVVPGVFAHVGVQVREVKGERGPAIGKIEFNPARVVDPEGFGLASVADSVEGLVESVRAAGVVVVPARSDELSSYRLKRLDVARDFVGVAHPSALIRGLAPLPRAWARRNFVHADPVKHGAQTLVVGSNSGLARLYDKFAETGGKVEDGTVRFEIEGRSDWLGNYGKMRTAADLDDESVVVFGRDRWEWAKMGVEVKSISGVVDVVRSSDLSEREQMFFLGWLMVQASPFAYEVSKATLAKFRKLQKELNVAFGADFVGSIGFSSRLDWDSGQVVTRVTSA